MKKVAHPQEPTRLRRLALHSQGLLPSMSFGRGINGARTAISHLGYIQVDTISVVERAHHHVFHTRVPTFKPEMTNQLLLNGDIFEYWTHAAALIPVADYRFSLPYKQAIKSGQIHWYKTKNKKLMNELLSRIRIAGPLRSRDLETAPVKRAGWWDWKPAKKALEQLYMEGDLMISNREGFQKTYDLTERVLASSVNTQMPTMREFAAHILDQQLRCHGLVSLKGLTYQRRSPKLRATVKALVNERLSQSSLEQIQLNRGDVYFVESGALERPLARKSNRLLILSPFDNSVIQRERLKTLFDYDYQIECYKPEAKRQYGYFCLPLLYGDEFVGRVDCKVHRKSKHLDIKSLHWEQTTLDLDSVVAAFVKAISRFRRFQQCNSVSLTTAQPRKLIQPLRRALERMDSD